MSAFGPTAVAIMRQAIEDAWETLSENERDQQTRSEFAIRVLAAAADGERDVGRLTEAALGTYYQSVALN